MQIDTHNSPRPILVKSSSQYSLTKADDRVIPLHSTRKKLSARVRLTHLLLARMPRGTAASEKMKVKAGPASSSNLTPTGEYSQLHGTPPSSVQLKEWRERGRERERKGQGGRKREREGERGRRKGRREGGRERGRDRGREEEREREREGGGREGGREEERERGEWGRVGGGSKVKAIEKKTI